MRIVLKPDSKTTPMRIVFNSGSSYMGHVLNDYWEKGPNTVGDMIVILLRFRQFEVAIAGDIKTMYNAIRLSMLDEPGYRITF